MRDVRESRCKELLHLCLISLQMRLWVKDDNVLIIKHITMAARELRLRVRE